MKWQRELPATKNREVGKIDLTPAKKTIVIVGGNLQRYRDVIQWMYTSCNGNGLAPLPIPGVVTYHKAYLHHATAVEIGCQYLAEKATAKMTQLEASQISAADIHALWPLSPPDSVLNTMLVKNIASRAAANKLNNPDDYNVLCKVIPTFTTAIDIYCANKRAEEEVVKKQAEEAKKQAEEKRRQEHEERQKKWKAEKKDRWARR